MAKKFGKHLSTISSLGLVLLGLALLQLGPTMMSKLSAQTTPDCGGQAYDPATEGCCHNLPYDLATEACCESGDKTARETYNKLTHGCCSISDAVGTHPLASGTRCCGVDAYNVQTEGCCQLDENVDGIPDDPESGTVYTRATERCCAAADGVEDLP